MRALSAVPLALLLLPVSVHAADGDLDPTFGGSASGIVKRPVGIVGTPIGGLYETAEGIALQTDGKIVVVGPTDNSANRDFAIIRYNPDGSLDETFGPGGFVTTTFGPGEDNPAGVAIQTDGKIVVGGRSFNGTNLDIVVTRYAPDGSLDTTFGTNGLFRLDVHGEDDEFRALALQSDGKIVGAGTINDGASDLFAVVRLDENGNLDPTFGIGGIVTTDLGNTAGAGGDIANSMAIRPDGRIILGGFSFNGVGPDFYDYALAQFLPNGFLDPSFHGDGILIEKTIGPEHPVSLAVQNDGKIIGCGQVNQGAHVFSWTRYHPDGTLDCEVRTDLGPGLHVCYEIRVAPDGKIVAVGESSNGTDADFGIVRYNADCTPDTTFGRGDGIVKTSIGPGIDIARTLAFYPDGRIQVGGRSRTDDILEIAMARYNVACGNGDFDLGEECDDGNAASYDGCSATCRTEEIASATFPLGGGSVTTDSEEDGATALDSVETVVSSLSTGDFSITESAYLNDPEGGFVFLGQIVTVAAPPASILLPHTLTFEFDSTLVGSVPTAQITQGENAVRPCRDAPRADPDPCVARRSETDDDTSFEVRASFANARAFAATAGETVLAWGASIARCSPTPLEHCRTAEKSKLLIKDKPNDANDLMRWSWLKGAATSAEEFGNPDISDDYFLCLYDESEGSEFLLDSTLAQGAAVAGSVCGKRQKPCWKPVGKPAGSNGYKFTDSSGSPEGIKSMRLKPGPDGKSKIIVVAKGESLRMLGEDGGQMPPSLPIRVQLQSTAGQCWESSFDVNSVDRSDPQVFKAATD